MNFKCWLESRGEGPQLAQRYAGAVAGVISRWACEAGLVKQSLYEITRADAFYPIAQAIRRQAVFDARNTVSKGEYNAALNAYHDYLKAIHKIR